MATNPLANPLPFAGNDEATQEYLAMQEQQMKALESRGQPNLTTMLAAMSRPTPTGQMDWGAGGAELGRQQEEQEKLAPSLIQMRAGLASQKYELQNRSKALGMISSLLGEENPQNAIEKLSTGDFTPSQLQKLIQAQPKISMYDKNSGEVINNLIKNTTALEDLNIKKRAEDRQGKEFTFKQMQDARDFFEKTGKFPDWYVPPTTETKETKPISSSSLPNLFGNNLTITSPFGQRTLNGQSEMHGGIDIAPKDGKSGQPVITPFGGEVVLAGDVQGYGKAVVVKRDDGHTVVFGHVNPNVQIGSRLKEGDVVGKIGDKLGTSTGNHFELKILDPKGRPIDPLNYQPLTSMVKKPSQDVLVASTDKYAGLSPEQKRIQESKDIESRRQLTEEKEKELFKSSLEDAKAKVSIINSLGNLQTTTDTDIDARRLAKLISENRDVMDLMNKVGAIGQLAQAGMQTPWGGFSLDVNSALEKELSPQKQAVARQIAQITAKLNQNVMKAGKEIYGPTISTAEGIQMAKPGFQATDPSGFILSMTQRMILQNEYNGKIKDALDNWRDEHPTETPDKFFRRTNPVYANIIKEYTQLLKKLPESNKFYSVTIEPTEKK